ncbi:pentapeptide repeat-containing protein [Erythrobacter sp. HKB08]|uniref:pentapeptide repeat-containing protein n=1 Tax=Erythrobacter sp. HKB08 TaxID=2502843 RepID=UPI00100889BA|nr:pentapeptide repeat-containing protein [Erythrobacter sp. HKB08]
MVQELFTAPFWFSVMLGNQAMDTLELTDREREDAIRSCSREGTPLDAAIINGKPLRSAAGLEKAIGRAGAQSVIVIGGDYSGEDMRPLAPLLKGGCITSAQMPETDWRTSDLSGTRFHRVDLSGAKLGQALLEDANFVGVRVSHADFSEAMARGAIFDATYGQSDFEDVRFDRAMLAGARFNCGITVDAWCRSSESASFVEADLSGADISSFGVWTQERYRDARLDGTIIAPRSVSALNLADFAGPVVLKAEQAGGGTDAVTARISARELRWLVIETLAQVETEPSFKCRDATTTVEKIICEEYMMDLRSSDRDMAKLFAEARAAGKADLAGQRRWLAKRNRCTDAECLRASYDKRIDQLFAALGERLILAPDQSVTYHDDVLPLPASMRGEELYKRILPVLKDAAWGHATLTGREDGTIAAEGFALGGNAHMCGMGIPEAALDPETGWYSATNSDGKRVPLFRIWGDRFIPRYSGNLGNTPQEVMDFISCGARAGFGEMRNLEG